MTMTPPTSPAALAALLRPSPAIQVILMKIEMAMAEVSRVCQPGERWRMTIPVDLARDSDMILCEALRAAKEFIESAPASSAIPSPAWTPSSLAAEMRRAVEQGHPRASVLEHWVYLACANVALRGSAIPSPTPEPSEVAWRKALAFTTLEMGWHGDGSTIFAKYMRGDGKA